ncbi:MAG: hypothetical protein KGL31_07725 [candidate division NC10 bacterium]|nr:hypothetical protein [candidate division NC10 bacterium]MDE2321790.1 hypothetical protein [candidate division NC10 bacterium]
MAICQASQGAGHRIGFRNIEIMRAFVRLRRMVASNAELARRLHELEKKYDAQVNYPAASCGASNTRAKRNLRGKPRGMNPQ